MKSHPAAEIFPRMPDPEFQALKADIEANGLREPIAVFKRQILDGRHRHRACIDLGIKPQTWEWDGEGDPVAYVISLNLHRRHLNESQRAMVAVKIANSGHGGDRSKSSIEDLRTQTDVAELLNISKSSVERAAKVEKEGSAKLRQKVESGDIALGEALDYIHEPKAEQDKIEKWTPDLGHPLKWISMVIRPLSPARPGLSIRCAGYVG